MGVTLLQNFPIPADKTAPQVIDFIQKRISSLGAVHTGQFLVDCETYTSSPSLAGPPLPPGAAPGNLRTFHVLHNSEHPATVFSVLEPPPAAAAAKPRTTFTSDTLFDYLLLKLSNVYQKKLKIESKGSRFEIGDFVVKLGIVTASGSVKGILVEVEYLPCVGVQSCWSLLNEFAQGFLGSVVTNQLPPYLKQKNPSEVYTPADTIHQYLDQFISFRKVNVGGGGAQSANQGTPQR